MNIGLEDKNLVNTDIEKILDRKNIEKWLESIPEVARKNESTEILVLVYLVEMLGGNKDA
jgi:esterase/lipase superfamily enzyme